MKTDYGTGKGHGKMVAIVAGLTLGLLSGSVFIAQAKDSKDGHHHQIMWVNHMSLLPGDESVSTSFNSTTSGVGDGLTGFGVESSTLGEGDAFKRRQGRSYGPRPAETDEDRRGARVLRINE